MPSVDGAFTQTLLNKKLLEAARNGDFESIRKLLGQGADVNYSNTYNETAFYLASSAGFVECMKLLKEQKCDVMKATMTGKNALHAALAENRFETVKYLVGEFGNAFDTLTTDGWSAMTLAINFATPQVLQLLIRTGHRVNQPTKSSALHWAVMRGDLQIVKLVLQSGAEKNAKFNGSTPLHIALDNYGLLPGNDKKALAKLGLRLELIHLLVCHNCKLQCNNCKTCPTPCKCINKQLLSYCRDLCRKRKELLKTGAGSKSRRLRSESAPVLGSTSPPMPAVHSISNDSLTPCYCPATATTPQLAVATPTTDMVHSNATVALVTTCAAVSACAASLQLAATAPPRNCSLAN